jgi:uncharacterized OB-fold protein
MNLKQIEVIKVDCFKCKNCENVTFSYKKICGKCGGSHIEQISSEGNGKLIDFTTVYHPPENYKDIAPYTIVLAQLNNGCKLFGILKGEPKDIRLGNPIRVIKRSEKTGSFILELAGSER